MLKPWSNDLTLEGLAIRQAYRQEWSSKCSKLPDGTWPIYARRVNDAVYRWFRITILGGKISNICFDDMQGIRFQYTMRYITVYNHLQAYGEQACYLAKVNAKWQDRWYHDESINIVADSNTGITYASFPDGNRVDQFLLYFLNEYEVVGDMEKNSFVTGQGLQFPWYRVTAIQPITNHPRYNEPGWLDTVRWS